MKNSLLVLRLVGTIKQVLSGLRLIGLDKTVDELIKGGKDD